MTTEMVTHPSRPQVTSSIRVFSSECWVFSGEPPSVKVIQLWEGVQKLTF